MDINSDIATKLGPDWLPTIYLERIRPQRTRSYELDIPERENQADIQYTLLGIELKVGKRRFSCPDLAVARYLRVFARMGCRQFAVPYDITKISVAADDLETSWQRILLLFDDQISGRPPRSIAIARSKLIRSMRDEIGAIGAGDVMPAFDRETRTRHK